MPLDGFPAADEVPLKPRSGNRDPAGIWGAAASESGSLSVSPVNNAHVAIYLPDVYKRQSRTLEGRGRVVVRPSGTEPYIRVMVEGESAAEIERAADEIAAAIEKLQ